MKAIGCGGSGGKTWTDVPDPEIQNPGDVIVKVEATTICGTDLHISDILPTGSEAYDTFARAAETKALKVVITA